MPAFPSPCYPTVLSSRELPLEDHLPVFSVAHSCPALCHPMDGSPLGSSVHGTLRQEYWSGLPFSTPGDLPHPGIKTSFLLVFCNGRLILYHCTTWEALHPLHPYGIFAYYSNQLTELYIYSRGKTRGGV